jgi:flagellar hook-associated protein 3 FlgL
MRVTDRMLYDRATNDGNAARSRLERAAGVASTGAKLIHPGDDPAGAAQVTLFKAGAARAQAVAEAAGRASDELAMADAALGDVTNLLARAREVAIQFSSSGYDAAARATASTEVQSLMDGMVAALNTKVGNRYLFAGTADTTAPFLATGAFVANGAVRKVEVAPGVWQDASLRADQAVAGVGGGVDVLATMATLRDALAANDQAGTAATLGAIATGTDQVADLRGHAGVSMSAFDTAVAVNQRAQDDAVTLSARLTDADVIQANTELALARQALEATLTATSSSFKLTLLNYLK